MAAAAAVLLLGGTLRAQAPFNPLRSVARVTDAPGEDDVWAQPAAAYVQPLTIADDALPPEPKSVVPQHLGELPPPADYDALWHAEPMPPGGAQGHIGRDSLVQPWFTHTDPNDPHRHVGVGRPLIGTSWLNRPWYVGAFLGGMLADDLISGQVETNNSFFLGGRLGWDFDHYWGLEGRYAFSHPMLTDSAGNTLPDRAREYFADVSLAYYPWGDSQWRPFFTAGFGFQTFRFRDHAGQRVSQSLLSMPLGVGLKFYHSPSHSLRLEAYDNIAFGDGRLSAMQNFTLAAGVEFRFGGRPTSYFPWHGGTAHW
jgi:hypothetical protein